MPGGVIDPKSPISRMIVQIIGVFAEFERAMISQRTRERISKSKEDGKRYTSKPPYGFKWQKAGFNRRTSKQLYIKVPDEAERVIMMKAVELRTKRYSYDQIRQYFNYEWKVRTRKGPRVDLRHRPRHRHRRLQAGGRGGLAVPGRRRPRRRRRGEALLNPSPSRSPTTIESRSDTLSKPKKRPWLKQPGEVCDSRGVPIYPGDLLKSFHFINRPHPPADTSITSPRSRNSRRDVRRCT